MAAPLTVEPGTADIVVGRLWPKPTPWSGDPAGWAAERLGAFLWSKQREILASLVKHRYTAAQSAHDTGKSWVASAAGAWWLDVHPVGEAFVVTTAPTWPQVRAILWRELGRRKRAGGLPGRINLNAEWWMKIGGDDELVAYGRKPADYDQAAFQGIHAKYVLVIVDEACGVPKTLFDAVDSLATNENARVLAIGNPDDPGSHFADVCRPGSGWHTIEISAFDSPNFTDEEVPDDLRPLLVSPEWVEERKKRWGESSPLYVSKVLGRFPEVSDDTLITPTWIKRAQLRELPGLEPGRYGADIARYGDDETVVYRNRGGVVRLVHSAHKQDTMATAGAIARLLLAHGADRVPAWVDVVGLGAGVYDRLHEQDLPVFPFGAGESPVEEWAPGREQFKNRRAEGYWALRKAFEADEVDLDPEDEDLAAQLGSIKYHLDSRGKIIIESKDDMRKRGLPSPDRADAVMMSFQAPSVVYVPASSPGESITGDLLSREL